MKLSSENKVIKTRNKISSFLISTLSLNISYFKIYQGYCIGVNRYSIAYFEFPFENKNTDIDWIIKRIIFKSCSNFYLKWIKTLKENNKKESSIDTVKSVKCPIISLNTKSKPFKDNFKSTIKMVTTQWPQKYAIAII